MPYKPKYCCQCGEKIDRMSWQPWTSRRFCELCQTELGIYDWIPRILVGIGLLFGLSGIGIYLQKPDKPLNIASNQLVMPNAQTDAMRMKTVAQVSNASGVQVSSPPGNSVTQAKTPTTVVQAAELKSKPVEKPTAQAAEKVYFCGAMTKKGTMCSRRVKNGGRCWQHEGQTAMLPQEKLIAAR